MKRFIRRALPYFNFELPLHIEGRRFLMPILGGLGSIHRHDFEPWMGQLLRRLAAIAPGATLIDVGVNLGQTLFKWKALDPAAPYIGFEPSPLCSYYAAEVIRLNRFASARLIPIGLSDRAEVLRFFALDESDTAGSIVANLRPGQVADRERYVPVFALDDVLPEIGVEGPVIVKIDVEGAELNVIRGMSKLIENARPLITCEVLFSHTEAQIATQRATNAALMQILSNHGYLTFQVVKKPASVSLREVTAFADGVYEPASQAYCDYLFVPKAMREPTLLQFGTG